MVLPPTIFACLAYSAASNFSFTGGLNLAVTGHVTAVQEVGEQPHARIVVAVDSTIAGTAASTVEVVMDPDGGCTHPAGEVGERVVIAAGAPGADYGVSVSWADGQLSPYNSATWVIRAEGTVASGPTLDGQKQSTLVGLVSTLRSMPNGAPKPPTGLGPAEMMLRWVLLAVEFVLAILFGRDWPWLRV